MDYVIGVDIGGTCTDCVIADETGRATVSKTFSTPGDFSQGVVDAIELGAQRLSTDLARLLGQTRLLLHATTIAENAVIAGELDEGGMLTTRGFQDTMRLMRGGYAEWSGRTEDEIKNVPYVWKPPPLIPSRLVVGIKERTDTWGETLVAADEEELASGVKRLVEGGAEAIGVCFLWSFANPANELVAAAVIKRLYPDIFLTLSHEVAPVMGEFERSQTVALNVKLGPTVSRYLTRLSERLATAGYGGQLLIMQAYGGLLATGKAARKPVAMIESGPVSGLVGSKALGEVLGHNNILGADMGGTTFKAGVIHGGLIDYAREPMVATYHYASPKMNIESIGLAGGSIISLDPDTGHPRIGPKSAGASPGPVCYDHGGQEPTVTDVDLILGYLDERYFLGGREPLNAEKAQAAFKSKIADPLGMDVESAAGEVYRLANSIIFDMLHKLTVERGLDPRSYVIFSTGGTAGMHAGMFAPELNVRAIVIPHSASVHGAFGLVSSDIAYDEQINRPLRVPPEPDDVNALLDDLENRVRKQLADEGFGENEIAITRAVELRYRRQVHVVTTPITKPGRLSESDLDEVVDYFESLYEERFGKGSAYREAGIEMVNFRVQGSGRLQEPALTSQSSVGADPSNALVERRRAYFGSARSFLEAPCFDYEKLAPGNEIEGPAIIWTPDTTVVVNPEQRAVCDVYMNIEITW